MGSLPIEEPASLISENLISELASSLKNSKLLTPASDGYAQKIKRWSDASEKKAGAVLLATSTADISSAILFSRKYSIDLAVRGGGHSTGGASSSEGGIVIDLSEMRKVSVDPIAKTCTAQGGCLWEDVDKAAGEHGLATVGGTVNHTGIGGLTLGGGYGWLSGIHGLVIDNLVEVQLVLADGNVVKTSETKNTELWWGVRGAGSSFGVAAEFTYRLHEQKDPVWAGMLGFSPDKMDEVITFANHLSKTSKGESGMITGFVAPPPMRAPIVLAAVFYNGPEDKALGFYGPLLDHGPVLKQVGMMPYSALNGIINPVTQPGNRKASKGVAIATPVRTEFFRSLFDDFVSLLKEIPDGAGSIIGIEYYVTEKICAVSNTATAFANRGSYQNALINMEWTDPKNDAACRMFARMLAEKFRAEMERGSGKVMPPWRWRAWESMGTVMA